jgi:putative FmdB family regulatory protein
MPIYIYHCAECGVEFEKHQHYTDKPLKRCPECGHESLHKVYTPVGVIYKGSGFYSTDHKSSSYSASARTAKKEETKKSDTPGSATTTTPEPAKATKPAPAAE